MEYRLIGLGRLVEGTDEMVAIGELARLTGMSEQKVRDRLLSGTRVKLKSSTDKDRIQSLYSKLQKIGLDVEIEQGRKSAIKNAKRSPKNRSPREPRPAGSRKKWLLATTLVLLLLLGAGGTYLWQLTRIAYPPEAVAAEQALANGELVAIGHANVSKLVVLNRLAFGQMDPAALPVGEAQKELLDELLDGPPRLRKNLDQLLVAVYAADGEAPGKTAMLMLGNFDRQALLGSYRQYYQVDGIGDSAGWYVLQDRPGPDTAKRQCPDEAPGKGRQQPAYLFADGTSILLIDNLDYGKQLVRRVQEGAAAQQSLSRWQRYREGKLASLMVLSVPRTGKAIGGMQGMMMNQAGNEHAEVSGLAAGLEADFTALGMTVNLTLLSDDQKWKSQTASDIDQAITRLRGDSRRVTPSMSALLSRIRIDNQEDALQINVGLDRGVLDNISDIIQEAVASFMGMTSGQQSGPVREQIQSSPADYSQNSSLASLPPLKLESYETEPLFKQGPFAVDLSSVRQNDDGVLELQLEGKVSLPENTNDGNDNRTGELALFVSRVTDNQGENLLRDEYCMSPADLFGRSPNHQPETSGMLLQNKATVSKYLRLQPGVRARDIRRIEGYIRFTSPVSVREYAVPLQAGESIEQGGMRFYLSRVGDNSVSYQVSGKTEKLLEVRALNRQGKVLRTSWRIGSMNDSRVTQNYQGKVDALKIFVAENMAVHRADFQLDDFFTAAEKAEERRPAYLAPEKIAVSNWDEYKTLDMLRLDVDPKKWPITGKSRKPVAEEHWRGLSLYLTHSPSQWGNSPWAHVYYPMIEQLPAVLSAFSYQIEQPAEDEGPAYHYARISYPYNTQSGEIVARYELNAKPVALQSLQLRTGLDDNRRLKRIKGKLLFRLPLRTSSTTHELTQLWEGRSVDGVTVTLTSLDRGMFPGYSLKVEGDIEKLVNLYGLDAVGQRVMAEPINYQQDGYWTMTLPFGKGIESVELVLADKQEVFEYPFDLTPTYAYSASN